MMVNVLKKSGKEDIMHYRKITAAVLCAAAVLSTAAAAQPAYADSTATAISYGNDTSDAERQEVLSLMGIDPSSVSDEYVTIVTNEDEHNMLDSYLSSSVIGTQAISCSAVTQEGDGYGIQVTTHNINYCTEEMYQNALATAGLENADVQVAAPYAVSGTAALVGVTKAYTVLTGKEVDQDNLDAAADELVTTGDVGDEIGDKDKAAELIAAAKQQVVDSKTTDPDEIRQIIINVAGDMNINLSDDALDQITELLQKVSKLDLSSDQLQSQLSGLYDKLKSNGVDLGISEDEAKGFFEKLADFFTNLWNSIFGSSD